jgi:hypothetical protein
VNGETTITFGRALQRWRAAEFAVAETLHAAGLRLPLHEHAAANEAQYAKVSAANERKDIAARRAARDVGEAGRRMKLRMDPTKPYDPDAPPYVPPPAKP